MKRFVFHVSAALACSLACLGAASGTTTTAYFVGNSLAAQTQGPIPILASESGDNVTMAIHLLCGSSLTTIVANPTVTCVPPDPTFSYFGNALPNFAWNTVTLEPYGDAFAAGRQSADYLIDLTRQNPANQNATKFYLLSAWPQGESSDSYATRWNRSYAQANDNYESRWSRQYAISMLSAIRADKPNVSLAMVPSGEVLYQLDLLARSGKFASFGSAEQLYQDSYHLTNLGAYVAGLTWFTTVFGESPIGLAAPDVLNLSDADAQLIDQTVWSVVTSNANLTLIPEPGLLWAVSSLSILALRRRHNGAH